MWTYSTLEIIIYNKYIHVCIFCRRKKKRASGEMQHIILDEGGCKIVDIIKDTLKSMDPSTLDDRPPP